MTPNNISMHGLLNIREKIYNALHENNFSIEHFRGDDSKYTQHYTCMYIIQDTAENLSGHRIKGFSYDEKGRNLDYLELVGVLQLIYIQQDSIKNLYNLFSKSNLSFKKYPNLMKIRELRNSFIGHPSKSDRNKEIGTQYSFIGRNPISYSCLSYENYRERKFDEKNQFAAIKHPKINLGEMIDKYEEDAISILEEIEKNILEYKNSTV